MEWFEVRYTDKETLEDYSKDVQANTAEEAKQIIESEWNLIFNVPPFEVWAVWNK